MKFLLNLILKFYKISSLLKYKKVRENSIYFILSIKLLNSLFFLPSLSLKFELF